MAETVALVKEEKKFFGKKKEADLVIFKLLKTNPKVRDDTPLYPPLISMKNTNIIKWEEGERAMRYLHGWQEIFVDEQEKGGRIIPESVLNNPLNRFDIVDGELKIRPHEKAKLKYLRMCNENINSEYRTEKVIAIFEEYNEESQALKKATNQKLQKEAIDKAFAATDKQIELHAPLLGIPLVDTNTSATRLYEAVVGDYRQYAMDNPADFLKNFPNEKK